MSAFRENFFTYTLVPLMVCVVVISYVRFMVLHDYTVAYEGDCDPYTQSCFVGCEDDACTEEYYYSVVEKYAPHVEAQCGPDITDCDAAYECLPADGEYCSITYCDPLIEGDDVCETLSEADYMEEETEETVPEEDAATEEVVESESEVLEMESGEVMNQDETDTI